MTGASDIVSTPWALIFGQREDGFGDEKGGRKAEENDDSVNCLCERTHSSAGLQAFVSAPERHIFVEGVNLSHMATLMAEASCESPRAETSLHPVPKFKWTLASLLTNSMACLRDYEAQSSAQTTKKASAMQQSLLLLFSLIVP